MENSIILMTPDQLSNIMEQLLLKHLPANNGAPIATKRLNPKEAVEFLRQNGFPMSSSRIYHLTKTKEIKFYKFGQYVQFEQEDLLEWAHQKSKKQELNEEALLLIKKSAQKKLNSTKNKVAK